MKMYYISELEKLKNSEYNKGVKLLDSMGNVTKQLDLNEESIPVIMNYLDKELKRLIKKGKNNE